jgi:hypothetical protein
MLVTFSLEDMAWETASPAFCIVPPRTDCMMLTGYYYSKRKAGAESERFEERG